MKKVFFLSLAAGLLLALVSSLLTGFVTRKNTLGGCSVCSDKVCNELDSFSNAHPAPKDFLWAAASASYQIEGDYEGALSGGVRQGRGWTNWDYITHNVGIADNASGDDGSKLLEKLDEDISLMKESGINAYRFSLAWSRLIPSGYMNPTEEQLNVDKWFRTTNSAGEELESFARCKRDNDDPDGTKYCKPWQVKGGWNEAGEALYRTFANKLKEAGITPMITLYHWDHPLEFNTWGGWRNRTMVDRYTEYVTEVFTRMSDLSEYWIATNENASGPCLLEYETVQGTFPAAQNDPNLHTEPENFDIGPKNYLSLRHNLVRAVHRAFKVAKDLKARGVMKENIKVGTTMAIVPGYTDKYSPEYLQAAEYFDHLVNKIDFHTAIIGAYPTNMNTIWNTYFGDNTTFGEIVTLNDLDEIASATTDFLGVNYYTPMFIEPRPVTEDWWRRFGLTLPEEEDIERFSNGFIYPNALRDFLRKLKLEYGNIPVYITENGYGPKDATQQDMLQADGSVNDSARCKYVQRHIKGVLEAAAAGVDVRSYTLWSSHDNLEWVGGYFVRFGAIYVDFEKGYARYPKKSYYAYKKIIEDNGVMEHGLCDTVAYKGQKGLAD